MDVCDVCGSRPEFLNEDIPVLPKICSIHPIIRHTKPVKKIPPVSFPFPVRNVEGVWKKIENHRMASLYTVYLFSSAQRQHVRVRQLHSLAQQPTAILAELWRTLNLKSLHVIL
jgi:hypothetical protein